MIVFNEYLKLTRLHKPIGIFLLFVPCLFSLALISGSQFFFHFKVIFLYLIGSILMRSAACVINDIFDKDFDSKVQRTASRPLAKGSVSLKEAVAILILLLLLSLLILIQFNIKTVIAGLFISVFVALYPLMKRITYYPQFFLGITINFGVIMMSLSITNNVDIGVLLLYIVCFFWTIFYDTIYAYQDIKDDLLIGVKSTAIKFKNCPKLFINIVIFLMLLIILIIGFIKDLSIYFFLINIVNFLILFYKITKLNIDSPIQCASLFNHNYFFGIVILISLIIS